MKVSDVVVCCVCTTSVERNDQRPLKATVRLSCNLNSGLRKICGIYIWKLLEGNFDKCIMNSQQSCHFGIATPCFRGHRKGKVLVR